MEPWDGCHARCRRDGALRLLADLEVEAAEARGFAAGYLEGFVAALTSDERLKLGLPVSPQYERRLAEMRVVADQTRPWRRRSPGWPEEFPGGWPIPPTYMDPDAPPMRVSRDGWPIPPQLLEGR